MGPRYQLTNLSPPRVSEPPSFASLLCSTLAIPHHCFFLSAKLERKRTADHATVSPVLKASAARFSARRRSLSLSLCPGIPTFRHSLAQRSRMRSQGSFSFSFLTPNASRRLFLLAESALFTLLSLLFAADSGTLEFAIAFFLLPYAFCHLADLRFSFFFLSFSHQARVLRPQQSLSADADPLSSNILALLLDASTVGTRAEDLSPSTGIPAAVLKQALYDSKGTSPRSTRPLPSSRRRRSAPSSDKDVVKPRA